MKLTALYLAPILITVLPGFAIAAAAAPGDVSPDAVWTSVEPWNLLAQQMILIY
jgi:hypothetical protein